MSDAKSLLPAEPWWHSEVQLRAVIAIATQGVSVLLRIAGHFIDVSITADMVNAVAADVTQGVAIFIGILAIVKRGNTSVAPLTLSKDSATLRNAQNPPILKADPTKEAS